jgi:hypothetical protein
LLATNASDARREARMHKNVRTRGHVKLHETAPVGFIAHANRPSGWETEPNSPSHQRPMPEELSGGDTDTWSGTDIETDHEEVKLWRKQDNAPCSEDEGAWKRLPREEMTTVQLRKLEGHAIEGDEIVFGLSQQPQHEAPRLIMAHVLPRRGTLTKGIEKKMPEPKADTRCEIRFLNALQCVEFSALHRTMEKAVKGQAAQLLLAHRAQNLIEAIGVLDLHYGRHRPTDMFTNFLKVIQEPWQPSKKTFAIWIGEKKTLIAKCKPYFANNAQVNMWMRYILTDLMPDIAPYNGLVSQYRHQLHITWEALEREWGDLALRHRNGAKQQVGGNIYNTNANNSQQQQQKKKKNQQNNNQQQSDDKRFGQHLSSGNAKQKKGKKRPPPTVDGGGVKKPDESNGKGGGKGSGKGGQKGKGKGGKGENKRWNNESGDPGAKRSRYPKGPCYNCNKPGHIARDCRTKSSGSVKVAETSTKGEARAKIQQAMENFVNTLDD